MAAGILKRISISALSFCVLTLSGCAVGPDYTAPEIQLPEAWQTKSSATSEQASAAVDQSKQIDRWWELFSDPVLNQLIEHAVGSEADPRNFDLRIAVSRVKQARELVRVAQAAWLPSMSSTSSFTRSRISANSLLGASAGSGGGGFSFLPGFTNNLFSVGFDAMWELDFFGKTARAVEAEEAMADATEENYNQVLLTLVAEIARNYIEYRASDERLEAVTRNIKAQRESLSLTQSRFSAGMTSQLDVFQADAQLATTESQKPVLQYAKDQARNRLAVLLGEFPPFVSVFFESRAGQLPRDIHFIPNSLPSDLIRKRPDIRAAERQLAASTARIGVSTAAFFPSFSIAVAGSLQSRDSNNWLDYASRSWSVGPSVRLPIFEGGRLVASLRAADADQEAVFENFRKTVYSSVEEVENAISSYTQEQSRFETLSRALEANRQSVDISRRLYTEGLADFLRVLEAERSLYTTEDSVIATKAARITSAIALFKALGGGWDRSEPISVQ